MPEKEVFEVIFYVVANTVCVNTHEADADATCMEYLTLVFNTEVVSTDKACSYQVTNLLNLLAVFRDAGLHPLFGPSTDYLRPSRKLVITEYTVDLPPSHLLSSHIDPVLEGYLKH